MKRRILLFALICCANCVFGQHAANNRKSQRVIITVDYCYNLLLKNPLSGFFSKNSLPYAMTYIASHRADKSQNVIVINLGDSMARAYRFANPFIGVADTMIRTVGYDTIAKLPDKIREFINSQEVKDSVASFRAAPLNQRGAHILVAQVVDNKLTLRSVDVTQYYPDKQTTTACERISEKLEHFFRDPVFGDGCVGSTVWGDPIDMLYGKSQYSDLFHQFQIDRTAADISLFAASNLVKIDSTITFADICDLLPYDNKLVTINMNGEQIKIYIEKTYAAKWLTMRTDDDDLLRLTHDADGRYRTMKALHNIDDIQGVSMTVNLRRSAGHKVKIDEIAGREFSDTEQYSVATTSFRAAQLVAEKIIAEDAIKIVSENYTLDFIKYIRQAQPKQMSKSIVVEPQEWLEKAYLREIPFIRRAEIWTM